jgi:hypothetical protein
MLVVNKQMAMISVLVVWTFGARQHETINHASSMPEVAAYSSRAMLRRSFLYLYIAVTNTKTILNIISEFFIGLYNT